MMRFPFRAGIISIVLLFAFGCAPKQDQSPPLTGTQGAQKAWEGYLARSLAANAVNSPYQITANLRYSIKGDSTRVSSILWGNGNVQSPYPIRLDLIAGVGSVVAKLREDVDEFLAYSPSEETAVRHPRTNQTLASFGVPIPLTINDLVLLSTGKSGLLFLPANANQSTAMPQSNSNTPQGYSYAIQGALLSGIIELSPGGVLLSWRENKPQGWKITFEPNSNNPSQPRRIKLEHPGEYQALIVIKDINLMPVPYTADQLALVLPAGTKQSTLDEYAAQMEQANKQ